MRRARNSQREGLHINFRDMLFLALAGFVGLVIFLLSQINPPKKDEGKTTIDPPGNVAVEIRWPDDIDADVDLWVQAPGDVPVGYSNKGGSIFNLLRDDLGKFGDATDLNYEMSYSRGTPPGEYTVNLHLYRYGAKVFPLPVTVVISVKQKTGDQPMRQVLFTKVNLQQEGEEITVFRFRLTEEGILVRNLKGEPDLNHIHKPLRSAGKGP